MITTHSSESIMPKHNIPQDPTIDLSGFSSMFDGWQTQIYNVLDDGKGGYCAVGWITLQPGWYKIDYLQFYRRVESKIFDLFCLDTPPGFVPLLDNARIGTGLIVVEANNQQLMTPEDFRYVDKLTQWEISNKEGEK